MLLGERLEVDLLDELLLLCPLLLLCCFLLPVEVEGSLLWVGLKGPDLVRE